MKVHRMKRNTLLILLIILLPTLRINLAQGHKGHSCGARDPSPRQIGRDQVRMKRLKRLKSDRRARRTSEEQSTSTPWYELSCNELCQQCIEIDVYFHYMAFPGNEEKQEEYFVIPHPTDAFEYDFDESTVYLEDDVDSLTSLQELALMIDEQMNVIDNSFRETPFRFIHKNRDSPSISTELNYSLMNSSDLALSAKIMSQYYKGDLTTMNIFLSFSVAVESESTAFNVVAYAGMPSFQSIDLDGIFMRYDVLPGGGNEGSDTGLTLVHEIGHWLGLYHTFGQSNGDTSDEDLCVDSNENDFVDDTPVMAGPTNADCYELISTPIDTCPNLPGLDPVFNYMNYINDERCMVEHGGYFTCGQIERMNLQWYIYRDQEFGACESSRDMEIEFIIQVDDFLPGDSHVFILKDENNITIYNSTRDYWFGDLQNSSLFPDFLRYQDQLFVDICVPKGNYTFEYNSNINIDYSDSKRVTSVEILVNSVSIEKVQGDDYGFISTTIAVAPLSQQTLEISSWINGSGTEDVSGKKGIITEALSGNKKSETQEIRSGSVVVNSQIIFAFAIALTSALLLLVV